MSANLPLVTCLFFCLLFFVLWVKAEVRAKKAIEQAAEVRELLQEAQEVAGEYWKLASEWRRTAWLGVLCLFLVAWRVWQWRRKK